MKRWICKGTLLLLSLLIFQACGSSRTTVQREQLALEIRDAVERSDFTFKATYAYPTGYKSLYLSPFYDVTVSPDTVKAYLPYYGRAYSAPMDPREGGYRFTSTDFAYQVSPGDNEENWLVKVVFNDLGRPVTFQFDLWGNGTGRMTVNDANRQAISFQGDIVIKKEKEVRDMSTLQGRYFDL